MGGGVQRSLESVDLGWGTGWSARTVQRQRHLSHLEMEGEGGNAWQQDPQSQSMDARLPGAGRKAANDSERLTGHLSERGKWEATGWSGGKSVVAVGRGGGVRGPSWKEGRLGEARRLLSYSSEVCTPGSE